jgi:hypothetical protein
MSFPSNVKSEYMGTFGEEKVAQSTKIAGLALGAKLELPDGRIFRQAKCGTALVVGKVVNQSAEADTANWQGLAVATAAAIGATSVALIVGGTAVTANQYADGYLYINLSAGVGHTYKIKSHSSGAAAATITFTLYDNDALKVAIVAASTKAGIRANEFADTVLRPAGTAYGGVVGGIPPVAVSAGFYYWVQRKGVANALAAATTVTIGEKVVCDTATAGSVTIAAQVAASIGQNTWIGTAINTGAASTYVLVYLELE